MRLVRGRGGGAKEEEGHKGYTVRPLLPRAHNSDRVRVVKATGNMINHTRQLSSGMSDVKYSPCVSHGPSQPHDRVTAKRDLLDHYTSLNHRACKENIGSQSNRKAELIRSVSISSPTALN